MKTSSTSVAIIAGIALLAGIAAYSGHTDVPVLATVIDQGFVSPGKTTAGITMTHTISAAPAVGQPLALELVFSATADDVFQLQISADDALAAGPRASRSASHGESVVVELLPQIEGRYYVNVMARVGRGNRAQARVFSIPVQVGKGGYESRAPKAAISPDGERLIRMQAQEKPTD